MIRPTLALLTTFAVSSIVFADAATQSATSPATQTETHLFDASYGVGYSLGQQIKTSRVKLDLTVLVQGLQDSMDGRETKVSEAAFADAMKQIQQQMMQNATVDAAAAGDKNTAEGKAFQEANGKKAGVVTTDSGLQIETIKEGTGPMPTAAQTVKVHYTGKLIDGTTFDSSVDRGQPISFPLSGVIRGWTEGLQLMKVGGKSRLVIPGDLAYGPQGSPPTIPPNATLVFDVELLAIEK